ncbi:MAG: gliding motility protein, partial [Polyangiaceae bacterium]|nr:gliding motility protein [Polyangiaceae bacterium]
MAQINPLTRELLVKLVYYGPGLGGKTTSLQCIHQASPPETRGQIVSLATPVDRTLYFDFLPLRATAVRGHHVRLQLFTVPGQVYFNATRKLVLTGADGVVFVADSQPERHDANLESLENLESNLEEQGRSLAEIPLVLQYNKRDLPGVMPMDDMDFSLNILGAPSFGTSASTGEGVLGALDMLVQAVVDDLERRNILGTPGEMPTEPRFARAEEAFEEQIGRASEQIWRSAIEGASASRRHPSIVPDRASEFPREGAQAIADARDTFRPSTVSQPPSPSVGVDAGPSWVALFPGEEDDVRAIQAELADGRIASAILRTEALASSILHHAGQQAGLPEASNQPALVASVLGLEGDRWVAFQRIARRARQG